MPDTPPSTFARNMDFGRNRVEPHRYGIWRYGVGAYSANDPTRFAWSRVKPTALAMLLALGLALPAAAADSFTTDLTLTKPDINVEDPVTPWGTKLNNNFDIIDAAVCDKRTGCTINGDTTVVGTMTATFFVGNASLLTGLPSQVQFVFEDLTSQVDGIEDTFTLSTAPAAGSLDVILDGLTQLEGLDYTITVAQLVLTTAPAADSASFFVRYATAAAGTSQATGGFFTFADAPILGSGIDTDHLRLDSSSVTLLGPSISASETEADIAKTADVAAATGTLQVQIDTLDVSTKSLQVQIDGITAASTVAANAPILGVGSSGDPLRLDSSSVTLLGPTIDHAELSFVGPNDHHVPTVDTFVTNLNAHDHMGGDGGIIDHDSLSNVTANQHHFELDKVVKSADESRTTDTVLTDDSELCRPVVAFTTYTINGVVATSASGTMPDIEIGINAPAGSEVQFCYISAGASDTTSRNQCLTGILTASIELARNGTDTRPAVLGGTIVVGSTGGQSCFAWSQSNSSGETTTVQKGSWFGLGRF